MKYRSNKSPGRFISDDLIFLNYLMKFGWRLWAICRPTIYWGSLHKFPKDSSKFPEIHFSSKALNWGLNLKIWLKRRRKNWVATFQMLSKNLRNWNFCLLISWDGMRENSWLCFLQSTTTRSIFYKKRFIRNAKWY